MERFIRLIFVFLMALSAFTTTGAFAQNFQLVGTSAIQTNFIEDMEVVGNHAYILGLPQNRLVIVDFANPANPSQVSLLALPTLNENANLFISGGYAYVATGYPGIQVIDITSPGSPSIVGSYNDSYPAMDIWISGQYGFIANGDSGFSVVES